MFSISEKIDPFYFAQNNAVFLFFKFELEHLFVRNIILNIVIRKYKIT